MKAAIDLNIGRKTFASGLLPELIAALGRGRPGDLVSLVGEDESIGHELETWCRFTGNPLLEATVEKGRARWVFRCGAVPASPADNRPVGSRLWLYTNFDCNLRCDYCCVRSSATAPRRELGLGRVQRIAREAAELGVKRRAFDLLRRRHGLDRITASEIDDLLLEEKRRTTMIIVTHDVHGARRIADRFAVLDRGDLAAFGTAQELENHENQVVRKLVTED
jgi:hypothetical protein